MFSTRQHLLVLVTVTVVVCLTGGGAEQTEELIKEDVIKIENTTQKVIRVNPLELPSKQDRKAGNHMNSELFQIKTLQQPQRRLYVDSKRMRPMKSAAERTGEAMQPALKYSNSPELKAFPKQKLKIKQQKQLHFPLESSPSSSSVVRPVPVPVQMTAGPYPIYYVMSKTNGRFGKFPIKSFRSPAEFAKYLIKSKAEPIPRTQRFESAPQNRIGSVQDTR